MGVGQKSQNYVDVIYGSPLILSLGICFISLQLMINILKTLSFSERDNSGQIRISRPTRDDGFLKRLYLLPRWSRNDFFTVADAPHSPLLPEGSHIHHRHLPILIAAEILRWTENVYTVLRQVACAAVASTKKIIS